MNCFRCSPYGWRSSRRTMRQGSSNTRITSTKSIPCFLQFAARFASSHSNDVTVRNLRMACNHGDRDDVPRDTRHRALHWCRIYEQVEESDARLEIVFGDVEPDLRARGPS